MRTNGRGLGRTMSAYPTPPILDNSSASSAQGPSTTLAKLLPSNEKIWHPQAQDGAAAGFCAGGSEEQFRAYLVHTGDRAQG
jgi:hypothetical protein